MNIRTHEPDDHDQLLELTFDTFRPFFEETFPAIVDHDAVLVEHQHGDWRGDYRRQLPALLEPGAAGHCLTAWNDDSQLVGYVIWRGDARRTDHAHVEILAVSSAARRQGVGSALMQQAMDDMRRDGRRFVGLGTGGDDFHRPARQLYEHLGFHAVPIVSYLRQLPGPGRSDVADSTSGWIRPFDPADLDALVAMTIETFRPSFEFWFPAMMGHDAALVAHQHGDWENDYRREVPTLHDPAQRRFIAVAERGGRICGYVAWAPDEERLARHAEVTMLAVAPDSRGQGIGTALMNHAMQRLRETGYEFVELGTGGDGFHAPARRLYESLAFHPIPVMGYLRRL